MCTHWPHLNRYLTTTGSNLFWLQQQQQYSVLVCHNLLTALVSVSALEGSVGQIITLALISNLLEAEMSWLPRLAQMRTSTRPAFSVFSLIDRCARAAEPQSLCDEKAGAKSTRVPDYQRGSLLTAT